ncbi:DUF4328 domain-containing protein [Streptomyces sp. NPDC086010]|uniref:DUF4328 domain-containing protein n=1 Tax=Streptomyces sp. NPDC086010 TaxID=3365745 RepID=UPI0037D54273
MQPGPAPMAEGLHRLRSPAGLAKAVVVLLGVIIAVDVVALVAELSLRGEYANLTTIPDTVLYDAGSTTHSQLVYQRVTSAQALALLVTAIVFIVWFRRVRLNAEVFDASLQPMRPGWAIGAWFIPIGNMWLPRRIAAGIWTASAQTNTDGSWRDASKAPLNLWWTLYLVSTLVAQVATRNYEATDFSPALADSVTLIMAADVLDIAAAVAAIVFVRRLTRMQGERAALGMPPSSVPAPAPAGVPQA